MQLDWSRVMEFILQQDPGLAASFVGVERSRIVAVEAQYGITLPTTYVDFLATMGEESGNLKPFGDTQVHGFSQLLAKLPPRGYPADRFFRIAFETDPAAVDYVDIFLDLMRSDGHDAPMVTLELPLETGEAEPPETPLSFSETITEDIFWMLHVARKEYGARIFVLGDDPWRGVEIKQKAASVLTERGFTSMLPDLRRVACLGRGPVSVLITDSDTSELVDIKIGGDAVAEIEAIVQPLISAFPRADLDEPPAKRSFRFESEAESETEI